MTLINIVIVVKLVLLLLFVPLVWMKKIKNLLDEIMKLHESSISYLSSDNDVNSNTEYEKIKNEPINKNIDIFNNDNNFSSAEDSISDVEDINNLNERTNYKFVQMKNKKNIISKKILNNPNDINNSNYSNDINNSNYPNNYVHDKKKTKQKNSMIVLQIITWTHLVITILLYYQKIIKYILNLLDVLIIVQILNL